MTPSGLPKRPLSPSASSSASFSRPRLTSPDVTRPQGPVLGLPSLSQPSPSSTPFQQPTLLTSYSMHAPSSSSARPLVRRQTFDDSALAVLRSPLLAPGADLAVGFDRATWRAAGPEEGAVREGVDGLVEALRALEEKMGQAVVQKGKEGVITWRGIVTKLLTAPYEDRDGWELNAQADSSGNVYLEQHLTPTQHAGRNGGKDPQAQFNSFIGYSFEAYATRPADEDPDAATQYPGPVDTNQEWCAVTKTSLGATRLILGGEVDCLKGSFDGRSLKNAVELKTNIVIQNDRDRRRFESKLLRIWAQSFLLGVPEVIVGFRSRQPPILQTLQTFKTLELPRLVRGQPGAWDANVCLAFGSEALAFIRRTTLQDLKAAGTAEPRKEPAEDEARAEGGRKTVILRFTFDPSKRSITARRLEEEEVAEVETGRGREGRGFLPLWLADR